MRLASLALTTSLVGCVASPSGDARQGEIVSVLARADEALIRTRPELCAGKYEAMAGSPVAFMRGSLPLYVHDARNGGSDVALSRFALATPLVPSLGDPHPENFGTLRAGDGTFALEPNDLDAADYAPYLLDVRRLAAGMALGAMVSNEGDDAARAAAAKGAEEIAREVAASYRDAVRAAARGEAIARVDAANGNAVLEDLFRRAARDEAARVDLAENTELRDGRRTIRRGPLELEEPTHQARDLTPSARAAIDGAVERWRQGLASPPPREHTRVLDAARELGRGVASWPRVRVLVLVRGATDSPDDDELLELKELADSPLAGTYPPHVRARTVEDRIATMAPLLWGRADAEPRWGTTTWLGLPCQIRRVSDGHKSVRVARWVEERGTVEALRGLGATLGRIVARAHCSGAEGRERAQAIDARIGEDGDGFVGEQARAAREYAEATLRDAERFRDALARVGPRLGVPYDARDVPSYDVARLLQGGAAARSRWIGEDDR